MSSNSQSLDDIEQAREREHLRDLERQAHTVNMDGLSDEGVELLRELLQSDLDIGTIEVLTNYISPDFVLSKYRQKDITKIMWQLETKVLRVYAMHPPQGGVAGKARSYYYDDPNDALEPLRPQDRARIEEYKDGVLARIRRSEGGFQQDKLGESASRVETVSRDQDDSDGRIKGMFG